MAKTNLSTGSSYEIFNSREQFLYVHMTTSYLRKQRAAVRERELRGGSTTALMALYWQLFPGEPQHRANSHGEKIMPEKVHWVSPVPEADKLPQSSGSPAKERGTDVG